MSTRYWILAAILTASVGTGCCYDHCGYYNSAAYDPCTGLVPNNHGCLDKLKGLFDKDDDCGCDHHKKKKTECGCHHDEMTFDYGTPIYGDVGSDCPCNSQPSMPTFSPNGPMETYVSPEEFDKIPGTPMPSGAAKPVPAPAAEPEPLPAETSTSIPPASYVVPAPLDGPGVPVLQGYQE